jgi:hypothetical protein
MSTKIENLGIPSIDSFKLRLEVDHLKGFDKSLLDYIVKYNVTTAEIESEFKTNSKKYQCKEYSFYASLNTNVRVSRDRYTDCITIIINSKQIKSKYFKGITKETIKDVYKEISSLGIINCNYTTFINGAITDIDIKKDFTLPMDDYKELVSTLAIMTKESNNRDKGCTTFKESTNFGIAWSKRETSKYLSQPYLKIYHKGIELMHHSKEFYNEYLNPKEIINAIRIETTIKNKEHLKRLNLDLNKYNLIEFLSLSDEQLNSIIAKSVNAHLKTRSNTKPFKNKTNMTPSNLMLLNSIAVLTNELNWSLFRIENHLLSGFENKVTKSRQKRLINELYNDQIKGTNYDFKSSKIDSVFDSIGWA